ncbi:MAG: nickel pincer cofactor biosynthesis protein LarB [Eubacterium sp.]|nr:nickel pincer cofactor biosynthesis protein LarB [Eubacterium sp.]
MKDIKEILLEYKAGNISEEEVLLYLKRAPFVDMGFAKLDTHRSLRQGAHEIIYGAGKTAEQIVSIILAMLENGQEHILVTRVDEEKAAEVEKLLKLRKTGADEADGSVKTGERIAEADIKYSYFSDARLVIVGGNIPVDCEGYIAVITAGTSDIPVAEEAARTAEFLGNSVVRIYDAGVAGLHRLLDHLDEIMSARVIIAIAGMEGALASVVGGLASCPVIAVPTSVGYGASFEGLSALLSMLNSCASGVSVVNIDNGFGAAYQASMINHMK